MIILSNSNIDIIQGIIGYGNATEGITDWRIENTSNGVFNILNSSSTSSRVSIIDNGNIGIGITPITSSSLLQIGGDVNITGNYKINNRDVINDTSNYIITTSNILIPRISTNVRDSSNFVSNMNTTLNTFINDTSNYIATTSNILANNVNSQWTSTSSGIYYNTPISTPITFPNEIGIDKYMIFTYTGDTIPSSGQTQYTINIPTGGITCDILMVAGGGAGGAFIGPGGGGGAVLYGTNINIPSGAYTINVGRGGTSADTKGFNTQGFGATLLGGGCALSSFYATAVSNSGGSGSGGQSEAFTFKSGGGVGTSSKGTILNNSLLYNGNVGGSGVAQGPAPQQPVSSGGGGGAGSAGQVGTADNTQRSAGGNGVLVNITGVNLYWGAGGGGGSYNTSSGNGGLGGGGGGVIYSYGYGGTTGTVGGSAYSYAANPINAGNGTGSGGGGGGDGGLGGSGIIIIKYNTIQQNIQKSISSSPVITPSLITGITTGTIGTTDRYTMFGYTTDNVNGLVGQTQYAFTTAEPCNCDILVIGGGGGGGRRHGGGGGAGTLIYHKSIIIDGTYTIKVGKGGQGCQSSTVVTANTIGYSSQFIKNDGSQEYLATGGGNGGAGVIQTYTTNGGGTNTIDSNLTLNTNNKINGIGVLVINKQYVNYSASPEGCRGNMGGIMSTSWKGGGGGGAGGVGMNHDEEVTIYDGYGGIGLAIDITGSSVIYAGGGNGSDYYGSVSQVFDPLYPTIQSRGGGGFGSDNGTPQNGLDGTGGGGGGQGYDNVNGGNGGSGIVIIRYRKNTTTAYVGIGTTIPLTKLHVYDDANNNTKLTIQNNYIEPVIVTPNTGYTISETIESNIYYRTLTFTYTPNYVENPPNTTLLAWWRLNGDGLDYNPSSTKYNLTTVSGTPSYSSDFFQGRRYFAYSSSSLGNTSLQLRYRAFSASLWVRPKTGTGTYIWQYGYYDTGGTLYLGTASWTSPNNQYGIDVYNRGAYTSTQYPGDTNNWIHLVYIMDTNYSKRVYRNGTLIAINEAADAFVGSGTLQVLSNAADISDVRIYTTGLTNTDVEKLYFSYINNSFTNNYSINFANSTDILVNGTSKTVKGLYNISIGNINSSMLPIGGQYDVPLASTATTTVTIKYPYNTPFPILPILITVSGATSTIMGTSDRCISFTYTSDSSGLTGQTQYTFTPAENIICDILIVGGGGGGGKGGGGGGGGGVLFAANLKLISGLPVIVKVGKGGTGATTNDNGVNGTNGNDSSITINSIEYIAKGGGGGGTRGVNAVGTSGNAGGSGGGGSHANSVPQGMGGASNKNNYANFQSFGNNGGLGKLGTSAPEPSHASGGGGGAGSAGSNATGSGTGKGGGDGGFGKEFIAYFGRSIGHNGYFAGGGGGNTYSNAGIRGYGNGGLELYGGGGNAGFDGTMAYFADNGMANTGGGGGGAFFSTYSYNSNSGGNGGSGFVIIRYRINSTQTSSIELIRNVMPPNEILVSGATSSLIGQFDRLISFPYTSDSTGLVGQTQYTFSTTETLLCDILIVGGGGGGGHNAGAGGGAGGLILIENTVLVTGSYNIIVGNGGDGGTTSQVGTVASNGKNTIFETYTAIGGGAGVNSGGTNGIAGGSGGGAGDDGSGNRTGGAGTAGQGFKGGNGTVPGGGTRTGGGGGGAGGEGQASVSTTRAGDGGIGKNMSSIFGTSVGHAGWFAGGGGGGVHSGTGGTGGNGGGGSENVDGINGTGGGGGAARNGSGNGRRGGSGIVIIRYRRNTGYKIGNYNGDFKIISSTYSSSNISVDTDFMRITRDGSAIYNPTGTPLWSTVSDKRIKENIEKASYDKCYDNINKLELYRFNYIKELNNINKDNKQLGYIAQEVKDIFPKAVSTQLFYNNSLSISDLLSIDISQINYSLHGAVKKLIEIYKNIESRINKLENLLNMIITIDRDILITSNITIDNNLLVSSSIR
jgi:hypothetical protein